MAYSENLSTFGAMKLFRELYLPNRFFFLFGSIAGVFVLGFFVQPIFVIAQGLFLLAIGLVLADGFMLFAQNHQIQATRQLPKLLSLGDENRITIRLQNQSRLPLSAELIDELPIQLQIRDFSREISLLPSTPENIDYHIRPTSRGAYIFGRILLYITSPLGVLQRQITTEATQSVPVYPSVIQMKKYELKAFTGGLRETGIKKMRRTGQSFEFDQLKSYIQGDDRRAINWKASSRTGDLMVNHFREERSQQVFVIIDKSRTMKMPFDGLTLMDYAINAALVISNIVLQKGDRAGLLTFSDRIGGTVAAERTPRQLQRLLDTLYAEQLRPVEADYELLFQATRKLIKVRSLLLLFTNFETRFALDRVLPMLRHINRSHLLVVVFFENTEIRTLAETPCDTLEDIYRQTIAQKFLQERREMTRNLQRYGIQCILSTPHDLTVNTINKYLELKSRGMI